MIHFLYMFVFLFVFVFVFEAFIILPLWQMIRIITARPRLFDSWFVCIPMCIFVYICILLYFCYTANPLLWQMSRIITARPRLATAHFPPSPFSNSFTYGKDGTLGKLVKMVPSPFSNSFTWHMLLKFSSYTHGTCTWYILLFQTPSPNIWC